MCFPIKDSPSAYCKHTFLLDEKMYKKFQLVNFDGQGPSTCTAKTDWILTGIVCQEHTAEALRCPLQSKRADKGSGYTSLAEHLIHSNWTTG